MLVKPRLRYALWLVLPMWLTAASAAAQEALDPELFGGAAIPELEDPDDDLPSEPPRILFSLSAGTAVRIVRNDTFLQKRMAPAFLDAFGAFVFGGRGQWRHGAGVGLSTNLQTDGDEIIDDDQVNPVEQLVTEAAYLGYYRMSADFVFTLKVGGLFAVRPDLAPGGEVAGGLAYLLTSGLGLYAEVGGSVFVGGRETPTSGRSVHPLVTGEVGIVIDYEVLP